jgi:hypothetical protein
MPHVGNHRHKAGQRRRLAVTFAPALAPQINLFRHSGPARHRPAVDLQNGGSWSRLTATVGDLSSTALPDLARLAAPGGQAGSSKSFYRAAPAMNAATMYVACRSRLVRARS